MKRILCSLVVATLPFGSVLADAPQSKNAKVTLVYQHELPNVPGKSIKGVLVEYGPGGYSPGHTHAKSAFIYATVLEGAIRSQVNDGPVTTYEAGQSFSELPGDRHGVSANASVCNDNCDVWSATIRLAGFLVMACRRGDRLTTIRMVTPGRRSWRWWREPNGVGSSRY